jgi:glycosyltransferase involved in cell wall biosynthesis
MKKYISKISHPDKTKFQSLINFVSFLLTKPGAALLKKIIKKTLVKLGLWKEYAAGYHDWISAKLDPAVLQKEYGDTIDSLTVRPKISIVMPVYNPAVNYLAEAINSVLGQFYENWELCISDDNSPDPAVKATLKKFSAQDARIKVKFRTENGHISVNTNTALELATGDYILFMDHDDLLTLNCLFEFVRHINDHPKDQLIYSDEDKIDDQRQLSSPHFKPDWAPDNLLSRNYMGHVIVVRADLMVKVKGFRTGFEGSQDHDFLLRATEVTDNIGHIPKVLYHWRIHEMSVSKPNSDAKPYAQIAAKKALNEALERRGYKGLADDMPNTAGGYRITYEVKEYKKVSIIIPTKDQVKLLKIALDSIISKTDYPDYEIILMNNNSVTPEFFDLVKDYELRYKDKFRCIDANYQFNFAKLMNDGVAHSTGNYILMLNNDVEVIDTDWMTQMVSFAQREKTGAVGVKLLYANNTIQHAGVLLGLGGAAGHAFVNMKRNERGYFNYIRLLNNYSAVTAACMMCRKSVFLEVGGMDELLDVEYNDVDLCLMFLTYGYFNVYVPTVELYHYESATRGHPFASKESWAQHDKDFGIFRSKWLPLIEKDPFYNPNLSVERTDFGLKFA